MRCLERLPGETVAAVGRALFPLALRDGREVSFASVEHGRGDVALAVEFEHKVKASTILGALRRLDGQASVLLQVEAAVGYV